MKEDIENYLTTRRMSPKMNEAIQNYLTTHRMSPQDFAKRAGITLSILYRLRSGSQGCSISCIKKIEAALEMDPP